jgi:hypothetical protein
MPRLVRTPVARPPFPDTPLSLFVGDGLHRLLVFFGIERPEGPDLLRRAVWGIVLTWLPLVLFAALSNNLLVAVPDSLAGKSPLPGWLGSYVPRESLMLDLATYGYFLGFIPLAFFAEGFIARKMENAFDRLRPSVDDHALSGLSRRALRAARWVWVDLAILVLAFAATWSWAWAELHNELPSWHTAVSRGEDGFLTFVSDDTPGSLEHFTLAGYWVTFFALPFFTYLWMRWAWKVIVWNLFLRRLSRLRMMLRAAHPDRTGGLGCLSDVQTSFAAILFGTGLLFAAWAVHKFVFERTPIGSMDVWGPIFFYIVLAPGSFVLPLFWFTKTLARVKRDGLVRYGEMANALATRFERRWMQGVERDAHSLLESSHVSSVADFTVAYQTVESMRVVPFDRRSFLELFSASATPFTPLIFLLELPEKFRNLMSLLSG